MEVDEKISECKKNLETELGVSSTLIPWDTKSDAYDKVEGIKDCPTKVPDKRKYFKNYKHFEPCDAPKNVYLRLALKFMTANLDQDYLEDSCQSAINDFESSPSVGWITNIRMSPCISDSINPAILCLLINVTAEYEHSKLLKHLLRKISGDFTIGLKFNTFSGAPKSLMDKLPTTDWTLKKVLQLEGEKQDAIVTVKRIEAYFKYELLLGSKVQIVDTSRTRWATSAKGKRALREGMSTQIVLNDKLLCMDLDETNVFGKVTKMENGKKVTRYLLEILMSMKASKPVLVRGEMKRSPLFHSCCPKSGEETTFYYPQHCKQEAEGILEGFPLFLPSVLKVKPNRFCRSYFIQQVCGGKFEKNTMTYIPPNQDENILEFIQVEVPTQDTFLSSAENNAMARNEDEMTTATDLRGQSSGTDDVSTITEGTENNITLTEKNKAMQCTAAMQAVRIPQVEAALLKKNNADNKTTPPSTPVVDNLVIEGEDDEFGGIVDDNSLGEMDYDVDINDSPVYETGDQDFLRDSEVEDVSYVPSVKRTATSFRSTPAKKVTPHPSRYPQRSRSGGVQTKKNE